jgi:hypothetical protein
MLKCHDVAHLASDYLDHQMSLRARLSLMLHLLMCGHCSAFVRQLRLALAIYPGLKPAPLSEERARGVTAQVLRRATEDHAG